MFYMFIAGTVLGVASWLLRLQFRETKGTSNHAKRGIAIMALTVLALVIVEYLVPITLVELMRSLPFFIIHLAFAYLTLAILLLLIASGALLWFLNKKNYLLANRICYGIHRGLSWIFPYAWVATFITATIFLLVALS